MENVYQITYFEKINARKTSVHLTDTKFNTVRQVKIANAWVEKNNIAIGGFVIELEDDFFKYYKEDPSAIHPSGIRVVDYRQNYMQMLNACDTIIKNAETIFGLSYPKHAASIIAITSDIKNAIKGTNNAFKEGIE